MPLRSAYVVGWLTVTAVATTVGMGTVAVVRGAVGEPVAAVTLSDSQLPVGLPVGRSPTASSAPPATSGPVSVSPGPGSATPSTSASPSRPVRSTRPAPSPGPTTPPVAPTPTPKPSASPPPTQPPPPPTPAPVYRSLVSAGGSVLARCTGAAVYVVSASPNQGYQVVIERREGQAAQVQFEGNANEVQVQIRCVKGTPSQTVEICEAESIEPSTGPGMPRVRNEN